MKLSGLEAQELLPIFLHRYRQNSGEIPEFLDQLLHLSLAEQKKMALN